jgi:hypothetical protein
MERIHSFERGSSGLYYVESLLWKRLWTCHKTDYQMNEYTLLKLARKECIWTCQAKLSVINGPENVISELYAISFVLNMLWGLQGCLFWWELYYIAHFLIILSLWEKMAVSFSFTWNKCYKCVQDLSPFLSQPYPHFITRKFSEKNKSEYNIYFPYLHSWMGVILNKYY